MVSNYLFAGYMFMWLRPESDRYGSTLDSTKVFYWSTVGNRGRIRSPLPAGIRSGLGHIIPTLDPSRWSNVINCSKPIRRRSGVRLGSPVDRKATGEDGLFGTAQSREMTGILDNLLPLPFKGF